MSSIDTTKFHQFESGLVVANCTPHTIKFLDKRSRKVVSVEPCGATLKAKAEEEYAESEHPCFSLVKRCFTPDRSGHNEIKEIRSILGEWYQQDVDGKVYYEIKLFAIIGSIISAQAWPGEVLSVIALPGDERKPPDDRVHYSDKFATF